MGSVDSTTVARGGGVPMPLAGSVLAGTRARIIAGIAVIVLVSGGIVATRVTATPAAAPVRTAAVTRGTVTQTVQVSGSINPATETRLSFDVSGKLAQTLVSLGQTVTAGQPLAQLDTSDLTVAVAQAQASLASAQANYQKASAGATPQDIAVAKQAVDSAKSALDQTQQSTANDVATAQQALTSLKSGYGAAQNAFQLYASAVPTDVGTFTTSLGSTRAILAQANVDLNTKSTADTTSAHTGIAQADGAMANAQTVAGNQLATALTQWQSARDGVISAWQQFDNAVAKGTDTTGPAQQYQSAELTYTTATSRIEAALASASSSLTSAGSSASSAQSALNSATSSIDPSLDPARGDLLGFQNALSSETQLATSIPNELTQMGTSLQTITSAVTGGYVSAAQAVTTAQTKSSGSVSSAQNAYRAAIASLDQTSAPPQSYDIAAAYAGVLSAQAALDKANNDLASATLTAPSPGVVSAINFQPGEDVSAGGTANPFIVLSNTSTIALHGTVGEADIAKLKLGQVATVSVDALGTGSLLTGKVTSLDPVATIQQGVPVYGVDVTIDVPDPSVRPGMTGTANVIIASKQGILVVPNLAIKSQNGQRYVQVLRNGKVENVDATFGISNDSMTEVTSGLQEGDQVVLPGPRPGASGRATNGGFGGGRGPVIVGPGRGG
ncbi:MAG: efflux RND transporter periplasmic adaptor subunit [Chloroflexota bacterium]|nr:efflux RND transporter periplasmic adaptor subunit [Chloroflexota bacterium]